MSSIFRFRDIYTRGNESVDVLMLFVATAYLDEDDLSVELEKATLGGLVPDEIIIVCSSKTAPAIQSKFSSSNTLVTAFSRVRSDCPVFLQSYNCRSSIDQTFLLQGNGPIDTPSVKFEQIKRRALTHIFAKNGGFVEGSDLFHFQNPSKRHTKRFIRLSNILVKGAEIAFVACCSLPFVPESARIAYIDTPSLYAVVAAINEQLRYFEPLRAPLLADNFRSYSGLSPSPFRKVSESVAIISASSSGGMANSLVEEHQFEPVQVFHILYLGKNAKKQRIVCNLVKDVKDNPAGYSQNYGQVMAEDECVLCDHSSIAIPLQGDQFVIAGPQPSAHIIQKNEAPAVLKDIFQRLSGREIFGVGTGRDPHSQPRQFYVNMENLLCAPGFAQPMQFLLDRAIPAKTKYVVFADETSKKFAEVAAERCSPAPQIIPASDIEDILAGNEEPVVVVCGVIETGRTLQDLSRDLRTACPKSPLVYVVGLSKTTGDDKREKLNSTLTLSNNPIRHAYEHIERLTLPLSDTDNAWTKEARLLRDPDFVKLLDTDEKGVIDDRLNILAQTGIPLIDNLFVSNNGALPLKLQPSFAFWHPDYENPSQADVYFTVASVLQELRRKEKISSSWFRQTLLHPENFGRFNDGVVQASLLRSARPRELNFAASPDESRQLAAMIRHILGGAKKLRGEAAAEFLLAIATRRVQLYSTDLRAIIETALPPGLSVLSALHKACAQRNRRRR